MNASLSLADYYALSPLLILLAGALLILLIESLWENFSRKSSFYITLATLLIALFFTSDDVGSRNLLLTPWIAFDSQAKFFTILFLVIGVAITLLSWTFFQRFEATRGEYYFLLICSILGLILVGAAADFLTLFLGLETLSISLYVLCGYMKKWEFSPESALKYFLMGSLAAAFLLYGIALIYGAVGTTRLSQLMEGYQSLQESADKTLFLSGIALITVGLAFKAAIVPFHVWAPDVYDGAPTPVTAFMAVGTKAGAFAAFCRVFIDALPHFDPVWNSGISLLAYATMLYANFVAIRQTQLRRFFAYSGISHAGFLLIPLAAGTSEAFFALAFYLIVYTIATLGSFAVLSVLDSGSEGVTMDNLRGLFDRAPFLTAIFSLCLLTLGGIPPTAGFLAKFYVFKVAFDAQFYGLVIVGLLTTILSGYYYLRIISLMFSKNVEESQVKDNIWPTVLVGGASFVMILVISFYPAPLISLLELVR